MSLPELRGEVTAGRESRKTNGYRGFTEPGRNHRNEIIPTSFLANRKATAEGDWSSIMPYSSYCASCFPPCNAEDLIFTLEDTVLLNREEGSGNTVFH